MDSLSRSHELLALIRSDTSAYLAWSMLLLLLTCYIIKALYFIRVFHRLGAFDDDDLKGIGMRS